MYVIEVESIKVAAFLVWSSGILHEWSYCRTVFCVANLDNRALLTFEASGLTTLIGREHFFWRVHDAVLAIQSGQLSVNKPPPPAAQETFFQWVRGIRCTPEWWRRQLPDCVQEAECMQPHKRADEQSLLADAEDAVNADAPLSPADIRR